MPNRYIKETCVTSLTLTALSDAAERFFWRLTTVADDYGRFDANPDVLKGRCVPTLDWNKKKVEKCLAELCTPAPGDEVALVEVYQVRGRMYGRLTNWKQHQRDRSKEKDPPKPKFPGPEDGSVILPQPAASRGESRQCAALNESESESENENESENDKRATPQVAAGADVRFEEFWTRYPDRNGKKLEKQATRLLFLRLSADDQTTTIKAAMHYADSLKQQGISAKDPKRFLKDGKGLEPWRDWIEPAAPTPVAPRLPPPQVKCAWVNGGKCEEYARLGSRYCEPHGATVKKAQERVQGNKLVAIEDFHTVALLTQKIGRSM